MFLHSVCDSIRSSISLVFLRIASASPDQLRSLLLFSVEGNPHTGDDAQGGDKGKFVAGGDRTEVPSRYSFKTLHIVRAS